MGHHYIPQYYLSGFCDPSSSNNIIHAYEKGSRNVFSTSVKNVANISRFYSEEVEKYLANEVEDPANSIIQRIRQRQPITVNEKRRLAEYMLSILKRVPAGKESFETRSPEVLAAVLEKTQNDLNEQLTHDPGNAILQGRLQELEGFRSRIENDDKFRGDIVEEAWLKIIPPEMTPRSLARLSEMTWLFLTHDKEPVFLTNDNPLFYFPDIGIGNEHSEVTFPLSSNITLWATWRRDLEEGYVAAKRSTIEQINRRTASHATRYVFHAVEAEWVVGLINRRKHKLRRLNKP